MNYRPKVHYGTPPAALCGQAGAKEYTTNRHAVTCHACWRRLYAEGK